ncbi:MAG: beta-galactosidase [Candidatus Zixiibacteriota bacterium]
MITYNDRRFIIGKEEYVPYAAELHYFRIQKKYWSICFERIKKAGFKIISSIVPWNLHEDDSREFDFSGFTDPTKDLIVFVELVREFGFKLILRPGPWVFSEYNLNGLPKFLEKYPEIFARTATGELLRSVNRADVPASYYPSIGTPRYMNFVRHYFNGLTEIIKNYVYPRGPLFLMELDSGNYFGGHFDPHLADYNEFVVKELFPIWLQDQYEEIKGLNKVHLSKYKEFQDVEPPLEFTNVPPKQMAKVFDWFKFKESLMENHLIELREMYKTFSCEPMFIRTLSFTNDFQSPLDSPRLPGEGCLDSVSLSWDHTTGENLSRVRHLRTVSEFPYVCELPVGNWSYKPERSREYYPIGADATRYMMTVGFAGGAKGVSYHMFAGRDHWYGSALASDGTIQDSYELVKTFNINAQMHEISACNPIADIGVVTYKPYAWESLLKFENEHKSLSQYLHSYTMPKFGRDLDMLKFDFGVPSLSNPASLDKFGTLVIPVSDVMDEKEQNHIIDLAKSGHNIILIGTLPQYDTAMQPCTVLVKALRCKTTKEFKLGRVTADGQEFSSMVFGFLKTTEKRKKVLAKVAQKVVALSYSKYKGTVVLISFDPSTETNHHKMTFLEQILRSCKIKRYVETSNPRIRALVHKGDKKLVLFLMNSTPPLQFKEAAGGLTRTAVRLDLKALGFKGARIKMTDLFATEEVISTTAADLSSGLYFTMSELDGRAYLLTSR